MSTAGPFDELPNEILAQILSHLPDKNKLGIARTSRMWRFLTSGLLNSVKAFVNEEYPFLVEGEKISDSGYLELFERQEKIYNDYLQVVNRLYKMPRQARQLSREDLSRENLGKFFALSPSDCSLSPFQKQKLRELAVASGAVEATAEDSRRPNIFLLMAKIGNLKKLEEWDKGPNKDAFDKECRELALGNALENRQLKCMKYLIENCEGVAREEVICNTALKRDWQGVIFLIETVKNISSATQEEVLVEAAADGDLTALEYFIEKCKETFSAKREGVALVCAAISSVGEENIAGYLSCVQYLVENCKDISKEAKEWAYQEAKRGNSTEIAEYLATHLGLSRNNNVSPITPAYKNANDAKSESSSEDNQKVETPSIC